MTMISDAAETLSGKVAELALHDVLAAIPAGLVMLDTRGRVNQANPAALALLGEPLLQESWLNVVQRVFAPRSDDGHEVSLKDGRRVSLSINSLSASGGQLILLQDLTETRRLQEQLARHERLSSMGHMVASLAHQLRTPLSTALLYAGHLQKEGLEAEQQKKFATKLKGRLQHMDQQIRDMLIFAKGETRMARRISLTELVNALQEAVQPVIERHQLRFSWEVQSVDGELVASLDSLVGALLNLVNNAVEAVSPAPGITLHLEVVDDLPGFEGAHLLLCVADDGPGIDEDKVQKAQEPFYTTKSQGTGLGLAIVRAVVEAHQGRFWLQSRPGQGVRAWIALPMEGGLLNSGAEDAADTDR
ncbi:sensor histidine kinase [Marinospirillum alkaliphilum]|uniref:histidine kinase n=1 Tax=Marinospirillum alkaliphilum DSM 21637 TaxID=1122209 RepID=A0A1K1VBG9_9GAMM|nr:ATP-binding protein [Marinospirillum alkaliphilum]SFX22059.1 two-component system, sensor histidine kinase FlrB [Marinospirillum alkaliphilum DSM 21637]